MEKKVGVHYYDGVLIMLSLDLAYFFAMRIFNAMPTITSRSLWKPCTIVPLYEMTPSLSMKLTPLFHYTMYVEPLFPSHSSSIFESSMKWEPRH